MTSVDSVVDRVIERLDDRCKEQWSCDEIVRPADARGLAVVASGVGSSA